MNSECDPQNNRISVTKKGLVNQLYKLNKKFHRAEPITATSRRVKNKKCRLTYIDIFFYTFEVGLTQNMTNKISAKSDKKKNPLP